jgi:hypothetical protein
MSYIIIQDCIIQDYVNIQKPISKVSSVKTFMHILAGSAMFTGFCFISGFMLFL